MAFGSLVEDASDSRVIDLGDGFAAAADQQLRGVFPSGPRAADEGIERVDTVHQAGFHQEVERPIDRGRRGPSAGPVELIQYVVCLHGLMAAPHDFEHPTPGRCEAQPALPAQPFGIGHGIGNAGRMIVVEVTGGSVRVGIHAKFRGPGLSSDYYIDQ